MLDIIEKDNMSLFEKIQATNTELLKVKEIIKERETKGEFAYTEHLIPFLDILSIYHLYIKTGNEKYGNYVREKFNEILKNLNFLRYEWCINHDFGIELLSDIDLSDITYLKQRALLLVALDFHKKSGTLAIPIQRDLFKIASYISKEEKAFSNRENDVYPDALICLVWTLEKLWSEALEADDKAKMDEISNERKFYRDLAYDLGHPLSAILKAKGAQSPTDNEKCTNYLKGALNTVDGLRFLESNTNDVYNYWAYKPLLVIRSEFYDAYVEKTDDFYLLSKCASVAFSDRYAEKISKLILSNDDYSYLWIKDLVDVKKGLFFRRDKYNEAYKKLLNYLCEKGHKNSIYERILDEIDEGINVEENFEKLYSFEDKEARALYDYKKNKKWNTAYFGGKFCDEVYPTCYREISKGRPKDVEIFQNSSIFYPQEVKK